MYVWYAGFVVLSILSAIADPVTSLTCLNGDNLPHPRSSDLVQDCDANEYCSLEQYITQNGYIRYKTECKDKSYCGGTSVSSVYMTVCSECCTTDLCSASGCSSQGYNKTRGPICYHCSYAVDDPRQCDKIAVCASNKVCSVYQTNTGQYILGCTSLQSCSALKLISSCTTCCSSDLCNRNCTKTAMTTSTNTGALTTTTKTPSTCSTKTSTSTKTTALPFDCLEILQRRGASTDGVYTVQMKETREIIDVFCDMTTDGGGWTVFQKRYNGSVDYYRNWHDYENGFGQVTGEFWLGLKYIYQMTKGRSNELRIDLEKSTGEKAYQVYRSFSISNSPGYTLRVGNSTGTAGDDLLYNDNQNFTTYDRDQDLRPFNCAIERHGAWWYKGCTYANLNGDYVTPGAMSSYKNGNGGVTYKIWSGVKSLKATEMKFRKK